MGTSSDNRRIAKNAVLLYIRMFLSLIVSLYTSRVVLKTLGVDDYGVYGVVGGVVGMFSFLNTAMAGATSRFLTFEMGRGDKGRLQDTFSTAFIIHLSIALLIVFLAETVGLWVVNHRLVLPDGRLSAARIVYQCSVIGMFVTIVQVPFSATLIAHERMDAYAYIEIFHVVLKLAIVFLLLLCSYDKLILYAILLLVVSLFIALLYLLFSRKSFPESHVHWVMHWDLLKPMLNFSGWNMLSECGYSFRVYGSNIVLNTFFGTAVNAAGGIATTVQGTLICFVANVVTAVRPQIIMSYSQGNLSRMKTLITSSIRLNLFLTALITIPLFIDTPYVLHLWLDEVPRYCVEFCRLLLFAIYITSVSQIVTIGIHASGNVRTTSIVRSIVYCLTPFAIYAYLKWHATGPVVGYVIIVISQMLVCLIDILILNKNIAFIKALPILMDYCKAVLGFLLVIYVLRYAQISISMPFVKFIINAFEEWILIGLFFWLLVFSDKERDMVKQVVLKYVHRIVR